MDRASFIVAAATLALFVAALFVKGFTHDLFLEAGVFLVSVKIIVMTHRNSLANISIQNKLDAILAAMKQDQTFRRET